jgi:hypothetical protein
VPITIPPFVQYQAPIYPIAGRWNQAPPEGDKFIPLEIDWGLTVPQGEAVQIALNNGPVEFTQIIALSVDNGRNGGDVSFLFPDTGKQLTVPAYSQGCYPVFTNALTFYIISPAAALGDVTCFEVLNSMPPPVAIQPSQTQSNASTPGVSLANGTTQLIPASVTGTLQAYDIVIDIVQSATAGTGTLAMIDGSGQNLWGHVINAPASTTQTIPITASGIRLRFYRGISLVVSASTLVGNITLNLFYSVP